MVLGIVNTKCPHGVFKAGEPVAKYCTFCNPAFADGMRSGKSVPVVAELDEEVNFAEDDCGTLDLGLPFPQAGLD